MIFTFIGTQFSQIAFPDLCILELLEIVLNLRVYFTKPINLKLLQFLLQIVNALLSLNWIRILKKRININLLILNISDLFIQFIQETLFGVDMVELFTLDENDKLFQSFLIFFA